MEKIVVANGRIKRVLPKNKEQAIWIPSTKGCSVRATKRQCQAPILGITARSGFMYIYRVNLANYMIYAEVLEEAPESYDILGARFFRRMSEFQWSAMERLQAGPRTSYYFATVGGKRSHDP